MATTKRQRRSPRVQFNTARITHDMAVKGWNNTDLARAADVSNMTVTRFLTGERQTHRTADRLARALGFTTRRYLVSVNTAIA